MFAMAASLVLPFGSQVIAYEPKLEEVPRHHLRKPSYGAEQVQVQSARIAAIWPQGVLDARLVRPEVWVTEDGHQPV